MNMALATMRAMPRALGLRGEAKIIDVEIVRSDAHHVVSRTQVFGQSSFKHLNLTNPLPAILPVHSQLIVKNVSAAMAPSRPMECANPEAA
jgi:hypothetical protein